uniref:Uncharacterized protein n=1 Tax=Cacopsylla melanoneura TaxID=428564 RepID=A0A8D8LR38_9HEMI
MSSWADREKGRAKRVMMATLSNDRCHCWTPSPLPPPPSTITAVVNYRRRTACWQTCWLRNPRTCTSPCRSYLRISLLPPHRRNCHASSNLCLPVGPEGLFSSRGLKVKAVEDCKVSACREPSISTNGVIPSRCRRTIQTIGIGFRRLWIQYSTLCRMKLLTRPTKAL